MKEGFTRRPITPAKTLSSRAFNRDPKRAMKAAKGGPVFITYRGRPTHVLLSVQDYETLAQNRQRLGDLLAMPGTEDINFEIPRMPDQFPRPAEFD